MVKKERVIFSTQVLEIGAEVEDFKKINMAILFGNEAPDALRSSCFIINVEPISTQLEPGMKIRFDAQEYVITSIGNEVQNNLERLGHTTVSFTDREEAKLPGTIYVSKRTYPLIRIGTKIQIIAE
ncbi:PTS glucitol/sorbitol transporter subunit IIA [Ligilactobacillus sp. WILCCON 0076]|uniref:PTS glucitol/sorbitol transporter subunit IIA n=1 Tax=Ligilactobacillus ubinensis TaxID=2876789 RepID=A0A9X2FP56_9LACO|nr:PTS glucitol/sorbitol transporter subunit IIA [Ligilactobacillus ubinensis]MCP0887468.1 PTS glucitol/sorbitol transporter subunit IIA [Ligilactobacillus ubinensis]